MNQFFVAHLRKDVGGKIERQRGGHPKLLANRQKRHCVILVTKSRLGTVSMTSKQVRSETCKLLFDITMRHTLREVGLGCTSVAKETNYET